MAFIYKTDKKTGKTYRITAAGWDSSSNPGFTGSREVPVISWTPQTLSGSTSLTPDQLNAVATVNGNQISGSFAYFDIMGNYISVGHDLPASGIYKASLSLLTCLHIAFSSMIKQDSQ